MSVTRASASRAAGGTEAAGRSIALMLVATLMMSVMQVLVRYTSAGVHPFEVAFFRNLLGLVFLVPLLLPAGMATLRSRRPWLQITRGAVGTVSMIAWYYGLSTVPLAEATALSFVGVVFSSIFAVVFLGESMRIRRWTAVGVSLLGAVVVLRPGFAELSLGLFAVLFSAVTWGVGVVIIKRLSATDTPICTVTWMSVTLLALSLPPALPVWTWPTAEQLLLLGLIGGLGTLGQLALAKALQLAEATLIMPLDFLRLVWAGLAGYVMFAEVPDLWTLVGGTLIVGSAVYIMRREAASRAVVIPAAEPR